MDLVAIKTGVSGFVEYTKTLFPEENSREIYFACAKLFHEEDSSLIPYSGLFYPLFTKVVNRDLIEAYREATATVGLIIRTNGSIKCLVLGGVRCFYFTDAGWFADVEPIINVIKIESGNEVPLES